MARASRSKRSLKRSAETLIATSRPRADRGRDTPRPSRPCRSPRRSHRAQACHPPEEAWDQAKFSETRQRMLVPGATACDTSGSRLATADAVSPPLFANSSRLRPTVAGRFTRLPPISRAVLPVDDGRRRTPAAGSGGRDHHMRHGSPPCVSQSQPSAPRLLCARTALQSIPCSKCSNVKRCGWNSISRRTGPGADHRPERLQRISEERPSGDRFSSARQR